MKKVLFVATVVKTHIMEFHIPYLKMFKENGWETAVAAKNDYEKLEDCDIPFCDTYYDIPFERSPLKKKNIISYKILKNIIDTEQYDIIHCHTPVGALLSRIAAIGARKRGTRVIYTAHGFHFYKGAPIVNWLMYFPIEWICSFITDVLITINQEDYVFAKKHMHAKKIEYVPGVGIDLGKFGVRNISKDKKREILNISDDKVWVLSVGELIQRKNYKMLIRAIRKFPNIYLTIAGQGELKGELESLIAELGLGNRVKLLGYRKDIAELCESADIFAFPSYQEGLSVALMEAMACGMPVVCSSIRGNIDLIDYNGGETFDPFNEEELCGALTKIFQRDWRTLGRYNLNKIQHYDLSIVLDEMKLVYDSEIVGGGINIFKY